MSTVLCPPEEVWSPESGIEEDFLHFDTGWQGATARGNAISSASAVVFASPFGAVATITMGVEMFDPDTAEGFVREVAEKFMLQRVSAPASTNSLIITITGMSPVRFAQQWRELMRRDKSLAHCLRRMERAEVIQSAEGGPVETVSLLTGGS